MKKKSKILNWILAPALAIGIGFGANVLKSETRVYWQSLSGYYSRNSQIELQPKLVILQKLSEKDILTDIDLRNIYNLLYTQIPSDLEKIKLKYLKRLRQLNGSEEIEISSKTHQKISKTEIEKRMNKNLETITKTVPSLVNIYIIRFKKMGIYIRSSYNFPLYNSKIDINSNPLNYKQ